MFLPTDVLRNSPALPATPRWRQLLRHAGIASIIPLLGACSASIVPPLAVADPVTVVVLDHGRHSSLVLPDGADGAVRYSYGDWNYYVLRQTDLASGLRALLHPTPAALGRQPIDAPPESLRLRDQLVVEVVHAWALEVERSRAGALHQALEAHYAAALDTRVHSRWYGMDFVAHPLPYTALRNSNRMVGDWLEALGCEIRGVPLLSRWQVHPPQRE